MNKWLYDPNYGPKGKLALAFSGSERFVERSINFATGYLGHKKILFAGGTLPYFITSKRKIRRALISNGRALATIRGKRGVNRLAFARRFARAWEKIMTKDAFLTSGLDRKENDCQFT